jgi:hypothetical protein
MRWSSIVLKPQTSLQLEEHLQAALVKRFPENDDITEQ